MSTSVKCEKCGRELPPLEHFLIASHQRHKIFEGKSVCAECFDKLVEEKKRKGKGQPKGQRAIFALHVIAWLNLIGGIAGAIVIWATMSIVEVKEVLPYTGHTITKTVTNPLGIGLGAGLLAEGIIGCALLLVICAMAENLIAIRKKH